MKRSRIDGAWSLSIASSWLWGLGFFFSIHVMLIYGISGFILFAIPNAIGLGLFGVMLGRHPDLGAWWIRIQARYAGFFLIYQVAAVAITLFAVGAGFWQPLLGPGAALALGVLALSGCLIGHMAGLEGLRRLHGPLLGIGILSALVALHGLWTGPALPVLPHPPHIDARFVGLMVPTLIGFLLGPWLDIQHWQRAVAIHRAGASVGRTYVAGACVFFGLICLNAALAAAAGLVAVRLPVDGIREGIVAVTVASESRGPVLAAFGAWVVIAMLSTVDSFYVATRAVLKELTRRSNNPLLALIPTALAASPFWLAIPALGLSVAGLRAELPMMTFLVPFATLLVGASACLVVETVIGPRSYDPVVCLGVGILASVPFTLGYMTSSIALLWIGSLFALTPILTVVISRTSSDGPTGVARDDAPHPELVNAETQTGAGSYGYGGDGWFMMEYMPTYDDTNSVGNIYFANYIRIVGKCRELFMFACMPDFDLKTTPFYILTNDFNHKFRREAAEFQPLVVRLRVKKYNRRFVTLEHEIMVRGGAVLGYGSQQLMFVAREDYRLIDIPGSVLMAFRPYAPGADQENFARPVAATA